MNYKEFAKKSEKKVDAWTEVLLFDVISTPFGYALYRLFSKSASLPYLLTFLHFFVKLGAAYFFLIGNWVTAPILFFIALMIDNVDGKIARVMFGEDPDSRGTTDFILDAFSLYMVYGAMTINLALNGNIMASGLMVLLLGMNAFFMAFNSTKFRVYGIHGYNPNLPLRNAKNELSGKKHLGILFNLQEKASKYRLSFYPSTIESEFISVLIFPFFVGANWLLILAVLITAVDTIASGLLPTYLLINKGSMKDR